MANLLKGFGKSRLAVVIALFLLAVVVLLVIWSFTSQDNVASNERSKMIAKAIENFAEKHFSVSHMNLFLGKSLNTIVRKTAHFMEYTLLGMVICAFLNAVSLKLGSAALTSAVFCAMAAMLDEFRQNFVSGRTPRLTDVLIDTYGALFGIALATVAFAAIWEIRNRSRRNELPEPKEKVP
jgi:VanZ family protein